MLHFKDLSDYPFTNVSTEITSLNRNKKLFAEIVERNLMDAILNDKRRWAGTLYCTQWPIFSTTYRPDMV